MGNVCSLPCDLQSTKGVEVEEIAELKGKIKELENARD